MKKNVEESINLSELKEVAQEFLSRLNTIDNELSLLKDRKSVV